MTARIVATGIVKGGENEERFCSLSRKAIPYSDRICQITYLAAKASLDAYRGPADPSSIGLFCGIDYGVYPTVKDSLQQMISDGYRFASAKEFILATPNIAHSYAAIHLGLKGPTTNVSVGSLSGLCAIGLASDLIHWGRADTLIAGGASSTLDPLPALAEAYGAADLFECGAFVVLAREGSDVELTGYVQRRLSNGAMSALIAEATKGCQVDSAIVHPGPGDKIDGLPDVLDSLDVRQLGGETLEAAGPIAVIEATSRVRQGASGVLVAFRDLGGRDGAALVVRQV